MALQNTVQSSVETRSERPSAHSTPTSTSHSTANSTSPSIPNIEGRTQRLSVPLSAARRKRRVALPLSIWLSLFVLALFAVCAIFADWLAPHDPVATNLRVRLAAPWGLPNSNPEFPLGADVLGRDLLSRMIYGARVSLAIGFAGTFLGLFVGTLSGIVSGYGGGLADEGIMFLVDVLVALPFLVIALTAIAILGSNVVVLVLLAGLSGWAGYTRLARGQVLSVNQQPYVLAARSIGATPWRLMVRHLLPNIAAPLVVMATLTMTSIILLESSLSFLGLGIQPPTPAWGSMLGEGRDYLSTAWWLGVFPGLAIMLLTMAIGQLGDWLRDLLDPTMHRS